MARLKVFNRLYDPRFERLYGGVTDHSKARPWLAECYGCPWLTFHPTWRIAFGTALRHTCPPRAGFR